MSLLEDIAGFLFRPYKHSKVFLEDSGNNYRKTFLFMVYGAAILSIIWIFFITYPEGVYYGITFHDPFRNLQFFNMYNPLVLILFFGVFFFTIFVMHFLGIGRLNYIIGKMLSKEKLSRKKEYLKIYGVASVLPILLLGVVAIFWMYFFEKLYFATDVAPFIDFTTPTIIVFGLITAFMIWKWMIEVRINQVFFDISFKRAIIPEIIQIVLYYSWFHLFSFILTIFTTAITWA